MSKKNTQRGGVSKKTGKAVLVYFPVSVVDDIDLMVDQLDTDRSKFIRGAVRKALVRSAQSAI